MKTLLSSSACNTGDAACLCSESARKAVMGEIQAACGADQSERTSYLSCPILSPFLLVLIHSTNISTETKQLAADACSKQKARRAYMPSASAQHNPMATPSSAARMSSAQQGSSQNECSCAANSPEVQDPSTPSDDDITGSTNTSPNSNGRLHTPSSKATPSSSAAFRQGAMVTPAASSHAARPSGADAFAPFKGDGVQMLPSMTVVGGVLAGVVGVFAAL